MEFVSGYSSIKASDCSLQDFEFASSQIYSKLPGGVSRGIEVSSKREMEGINEVNDGRKACID